MTEPSTRDVYYTDTHWEGKIGELILYDRPLSEMEMKGVSEFLRKKWISVADLESARRELQWDGIVLGVDPNLHPIPEYRVYPNPTFGEITIDELDASCTVQLLDGSGKVLRNMGSAEKTISLHRYPPGVYFISIRGEDHGRVFIKQVIKQ